MIDISLEAALDLVTQDSQGGNFRRDGVCQSWPNLSRMVIISDLFANTGFPVFIMDS